MSTKNINIKFILFITATIVLFVTIYLEHYSKPTGNNSNIKIPNFEYYNILDNKNYNIHDLLLDKNNNKISNKTIVHFWATWCGICKSEFNKIIDYAKKNPNTNILAISIDENKSDPKKFIHNLKSFNIKTLTNLIFAWDQDKNISFKLFGTMMVPENYIINDNLEVIDKIIGKLDWDNYI